MRISDMGRRAQTTDDKAAKAAAKLAAAGDKRGQLQAEIDRLESARVSLLAAGLPTVRAQIDHTALLIAIMSHELTLARLGTSNARVRDMTSLAGAIAKFNDDMRGLLKCSIDDKLDELLTRADNTSEARAILARAPRAVIESKDDV